MLHINNENVNLQRTCDLGGQQILGMGGSLRGYIETGNAYDRAYFKGSKSAKKQQEQKTKDMSLVKKIATAGAIALGVVGTVIVLKKTGKMGAVKEACSSAWTKIKGLFVKEGAEAAEEGAKKGLFARGKEKLGDLWANLKDAFKKPEVPEGEASKGKIATFFSGIGEKIKGFFKKAPETPPPTP